MRKKRAGKSHAYYNGYLQGPGGLKCPCCGAVHNAEKRIRRDTRQEMKDLAREVNTDG